MDYDFAIPASWLGKDLRIVAEDQSVAAMGWVGFSGPYEADKHELYGDAKKILLKTPMYLLLLVLPGFCLAAIAAWRGVTGTLKLGLIVLAGIAFPGYLVFFTTIALASLVQVVSPGLPYVFGAVLVVILIVLKPAQRRMLLPLLVPTGQVLFVSMFILSLGYLQGGTRTPNGTATVRFSHPLPSDNSIPYIFAEDLLEGPVPRPMLSDWLSSDRPPLQTGMILALRPWTAGRQSGYQVASTVIQSLWVFALWLLLRSFRVSHLTSSLIIGTICVSGFAIVNSFYVWPNLLAAAYLLAFATPLLFYAPFSKDGSLLMRWLSAFLLSCSLLAHGGTLFALIGLILILMIRQRGRFWKEALIVGSLTGLLYLPWIGYQKFRDPPGDRLLKFQLAGVEQVTDEPALKTVSTRIDINHSATG